MRETQVWSMGWEDPLEKGMVTHSSILAWRIPWTEEPGRLQSMGSQRVGHNWATSLSFYIYIYMFVFKSKKWENLPHLFCASVELIGPVLFYAEAKAEQCHNLLVEGAEMPTGGATLRKGRHHHLIQSFQPWLHERIPQMLTHWAGAGPWHLGIFTGSPGYSSA